MQIFTECLYVTEYIKILYWVDSNLELLKTALLSILIKTIAANARKCLWIHRYMIKKHLHHINSMTTTKTNIHYGKYSTGIQA